MWLLRKFYGGEGGCLPPTDPRILAMTPEQIELEFMHLEIDKRIKDGGSGQYYVDDSYSEYDDESEDEDKNLSEIPTFGTEASDPYKGMENSGLPKSVEINDNPDDWEDVEIDDFEAYDREG